MLKYTQHEKVQCVTSTLTPLNTSSSFSFAPFAVLEGSMKANLSGGGALASGAVTVGPPGSMHCLAWFSLMLGTWPAQGDLS